jgi:hypothetical protein
MHMYMYMNMFIYIQCLGDVTRLKSAAAVLRTVGALFCRWMRSGHRAFPMHNVPASERVRTHVAIGHFFRDELVREIGGRDELLSKRLTAAMPPQAMPPQAMSPEAHQTMPHHAVAGAGGMQGGLDGGLGGMAGESRSAGSGGEAWHGQMRKMLLFIDGLALLGLDVTQGHVALEMAALDLYQVLASDLYAALAAALVL